VFSGRQSPGGHNVVWGLLDALKAYNSQSLLYGFIGNSPTSVCIQYFVV
jgi:diphosphate-dependent phosphofructokinase